MDNRLKLLEIKMRLVTDDVISVATFSGRKKG